MRKAKVGETREHPMLCTDSVVRAILAGRQTQDRRPVTMGTCALGCTYAGGARDTWFRLRLDRASTDPGCASEDGIFRDGYLHAPCEAPTAGGRDVSLRVFPRVEAGDLLYCREAWARVDDGLLYRSDWSRGKRKDWWHPVGGLYAAPWRPNIHHSKAAARLWLRVEWVRIERLQAIDEAGCRAEGCDGRQAFADLWDRLYGAKGAAWKTNPWVVACGFSVASRTGRAGVEGA